jgi:hypothetical protein
MINLNIKPNHKSVKAYYEAISSLSELGVSHEGAVSPAFASLLRHCGNQFNQTLVEKYPLKPSNHGHTLFIDGARWLIPLTLSMAFGKLRIQVMTWIRR